MNQQVISATFKHFQGYLFNRVYNTRRGFILGVRKGGHCTFLHAVITPECKVIKGLSEFEQYVKEKK